MGGIDYYERMAITKSRMLYELIDKSNGYYVNSTEHKFRSRMNVNFRIEGDRTLEKKMMSEAAKYKIININGHPKNPGIRISMYNAMPLNGVVELCKFMDHFRLANPIGKTSKQNKSY